MLDPMSRTFRPISFSNPLLLTTKKAIVPVMAAISNTVSELDIQRCQISLMVRENRFTIQNSLLLELENYDEGSNHRQACK